MHGEYQSFGTTIHSDILTLLTISKKVAIAEILGDPYVKMVPLPRIPNYCDLGRRPNLLSVRNSNIAERTQVRKNLNLLNGQAELMTSQSIRLIILLAQ